MPIREHPPKGTILLCNFDQGFVPPEMVKLRPVVVVSPKIHARYGLCTVVALSTTPPEPVMPYHMQIDLPGPSPSVFQSNGIWVKGDMINTVGFHRLDFIRMGKTSAGKRIYYYKTILENEMKRIENCVLKGMGIHRN